MRLRESDLGTSGNSRTGRLPCVFCIGGMPGALILTLPDTGPEGVAAGRNRE